MSAVSAREADTVLQCRGLEAGYGRLAVVRGLDLTVRAGEIVALVGPNGAGKSTTLLTLAGDLPRLGGDVSFLGQSTTEPLFRRARRGLALVTEERSIFMHLSTADNLRLGRVDRDRAIELFPELEPLMRRAAGLLSGGEQQMLTLARALAREPRVLLVDELSLGLAPLIVARLLDRVRWAATEQRVGVVVVEQHFRQALSIADQVVVMQRGQVVLSGTPDEFSGRLGDLQSAYLPAAREVH